MIQSKLSSICMRKRKSGGWGGEFISSSVFSISQSKIGPHSYIREWNSHYSCETLGDWVSDVKTIFIYNSLMVTPVPVLYDTLIFEDHQKISGSNRFYRLILPLPPPSFVICVICLVIIYSFFLYWKCSHVSSFSIIWCLWF